MSNITFRQLDTSDAKHYQTLRLEALTVNPESFLSTVATEQKKSLISYEYELKAAVYPPVFGYHGVFIDQQLVGYIQLGGSYLPKQHHLAFLYNLYIAKDFRRQKLAQQLITYATELLRAQTVIEQLFVGCNAKNIQGAAFYQALGFKNWGRRPKSVKWQGEYDDELEWVLEL
jgi:ribosomal protein S18 acetylase RimI-like enzyme